MSYNSILDKWIEHFFRTQTGVLKLDQEQLKKIINPNDSKYKFYTLKSYDNLSKSEKSNKEEMFIEYVHEDIKSKINISELSKKITFKDYDFNTIAREYQEEIFNRVNIIKPDLILTSKKLKGAYDLIKNIENNDSLKRFLLKNFRIEELNSYEDILFSDQVMNFLLDDKNIIDYTNKNVDDFIEYFIESNSHVYLNFSKDFISDIIKSDERLESISNLSYVDSYIYDDTPLLRRDFLEIVLDSIDNNKEEKIQELTNMLEITREDIISLFEESGLNTNEDDVEDVFNTINEDINFKEDIIKSYNARELFSTKLVEKKILSHPVFNKFSNKPKI